MQDREYDQIGTYEEDQNEKKILGSLTAVKGNEGTKKLSGFAKGTYTGRYKGCQAKKSPRPANNKLASWGGQCRACHKQGPRQEEKFGHQKRKKGRGYLGSPDHG